MLNSLEAITAHGQRQIDECRGLNSKRSQRLTDVFRLFSVAAADWRENNQGQCGEIREEKNQYENIPFC